MEYYVSAVRRLKTVGGVVLKPFAVEIGVKSGEGAVVGPDRLIGQRVVSAQILRDEVPAEQQLIRVKNRREIIFDRFIRIIGPECEIEADIRQDAEREP